MKTTFLKAFGTGLAAMALLFVLANSARASIVAVGPPLVGNSYAVEFNQSGVGSFDQIIGVVSIGAFNATTETYPYPPPAGNTITLPGGLSASGWSSTLSGDASTATLSGGPAASLNFWATFAPDLSAPLDLVFYTYSGTSLLDTTYLSWNTASQEFDVVPEPSTMIAGALLLLPFGASTLWIVRKQSRAA